jgi:hypothetical protein
LDDALEAFAKLAPRQVNYVHLKAEAKLADELDRRYRIENE